MSCGDPHETDCGEVLDRVYEYLDGEIGGLDHSKIKQHLDECSPCLREFGIEDEVKRLVKRSCAEAAPEELRLKVMAKISALRVQSE